MNQGKRRLLPSNVKPRDRECDFYRNPTILSRLIQNFKYRAAVQRLERNGPAEASVWVCSRRAEEATKKNTGSTAAKSLTSSIISHAKQVYGYRQLPIHMACDSLFQVADESLRADLESLIAHLVLAFPEGCARRDHEGKLPLHEAIWHDASPETVSALLMAYPQAGRKKDTRGRYPVELNEHRQGSHKESVRILLRRKDDFWISAGKEAHYRLKHRNVPNADESVASMSVLAGSVKEDDDTLVSSDSFGYAADPSHPKAADEYAGRVKAMKWEQIEKRAMTLESKLAESYEQNYRIKQEVTELTLSKKLLQKKIDKLVAGEQGEQIAQLVMEKEDLHLQLETLQSRLADHGLSGPSNEKSHPLVLDMPSNEEQSRKVEIEKLTKELNATKAEFAKYQHKTQKRIRGLEWEMERVRARKNEHIRDLEENVEELTASRDAAVGAFSADKTMSPRSDEETSSTSESPGPITPSTPGCDDGEGVDSVLKTAIHMNGGLGLSPRLIEMWNKVNVHTQTLERISENTSCNPTDVVEEFEDADKAESKEADRFDVLCREAAKQYNVHDGPFLNLSAETSVATQSLMLPALDTYEREGAHENRIQPPLRGLTKEVSDVTMSTGTPSTTWTCRASSKSSVKSGAPRSIAKEISELAASMIGGAPSPVGWHHQEKSGRLPEVSELTMNCH